MKSPLSGKRLLAGLLLACASLLSHAAVPYQNHVFEFRQPNGETLKLRLDGNDYYAEQRTPDGSLVVYDASKRGMCYAELSGTGDELVSTGVLATNAKQRVFNTKDRMQPGLSAEARARKVKEKYKERHGRDLEQSSIMPSATTGTTSGLAAGASATAAVTGTMRGLTVIIDFPDQAGTITKAQVESFLNDAVYTGFGNAQSVRGYFLKVSDNKFDYTNTVTRYYRAKYNKSYYADNTLSSSVRSQQLITEALTWLRDTERFDFTTLTRDSSNRIKGLNFFYAGETDSAWSKGLWPHMGSLSPQFCSGTVCTGSYQITNMGAAMSIGVFAHESGHLMMGWPDLYDYDGSSEGSVASFCLMGYGGIGAQSKYRPAPPVGYFRYLAGWDTAIELNPAINAQAPKGRLALTSGAHTLYRWSNPANAQEAFYLEAIHQSDQNLHQPDQGLAVYHVDPAGSNNNEWHPYVQMEHADGRHDPEYKINRGDATDLYDGSTLGFYNTMPNALTSRGTNSKWWNGYASGFGVAKISVPAQTIGFDIVNGDGTPKAEVTTGYLQDKGRAVHPWFNYAGGTLKITLSGPSTSDFELQLDKWVNGAWVKVAESTLSSSQESITYAAAAAYYQVTVYSYSGAGYYTLSVTK